MSIRDELVEMVALEGVGMSVLVLVACGLAAVAGVAAVVAVLWVTFPYWLALLLPGWVLVLYVCGLAREAKERGQ